MATINRDVRTFRDLDLSFDANPFTKDLVIKKDKEAVKNAIKQLVLTRNYERPFHPEIGCQVHTFMFEHFTPVIKAAMEQSIRDVITKFEPRARLLEINIDENQDDNSLTVDIIFTYANYSEPISVTTILTRVR